MWMTSRGPWLGSYSRNSSHFHGMLFLSFPCVLWKTQTESSTTPMVYTRKTRKRTGPRIRSLQHDDDEDPDPDPDPDASFPVPVLCLCTLLSLDGE